MISCLARVRGVFASMVLLGSVGLGASACLSADEQTQTAVEESVAQEYHVNVAISETLVAAHVQVTDAMKEEYQARHGAPLDEAAAAELAEDIIGEMVQEGSIDPPLGGLTMLVDSEPTPTGGNGGSTAGCQTVYLGQSSTSYWIVGNGWAGCYKYYRIDSYNNYYDTCSGAQTQVLYSSVLYGPSGC